MKKKRAAEKKPKAAEKALPAKPLPSSPSPSPEEPTPPKPGSMLTAGAVVTGLLLGVMQWSVFFLLQSYLASTAVVYLLATVVWLAGSLVGMALPGRREPLFFGLAVGGFYLFRAIAIHNPYKLAYLPLLLVLVAAMGAYAGRFFRLRAPLFPASKWLFFLENTGFVAGMIVTAAALYFVGPTWFTVAPAALAALALATGREAIFAKP